MMAPAADHPGTLYIVATPIGNLEDITYRAVRILTQADQIACEDTRHTKKLLTHYRIKNRLVSCHEHNEASRIPGFITSLKAGLDIALVSDAGTPSISDPGYRLVRAASENGIPVIPVPGPSAVLAGLSVAGLATDTFFFSGFLPRKKGKRAKAIEALKFLPATLVFYESPKRVITLVKEALVILGDRPAMVAREITKRHEEYLRGDLSRILESLSSRVSVKGECSLFISGSVESSPLISEEILESAIREGLQRPGLGTSALAKQLATEFGMPKKEIYDRIIRLKET